MATRTRYRNTGRIIGAGQVSRHCERIRPGIGPTPRLCRNTTPPADRKALNKGDAQTSGSSDVQTDRRICSPSSTARGQRLEFQAERWPRSLRTPHREGVEA